MTHLTYNQGFCFTVAVSNFEADDHVNALKKAGFHVQTKINEAAPKMTDITILCPKGIPSAATAYLIIRKILPLP